MSFDYSAYYRRPQDLKQLQIPAGAVRWVERWEPPDRRHDIVLYLGCNILRTPDVAADVVAVFEALGLDFVAVAGVQFCCGITWDRHADVAKGQIVAGTTVERLGSFAPSVVIHWCPSCDVHFSDVVTERDERVLPFRVTSAAAYLAELAAAGRMPWRQPIRHRAAIHGHVGRSGHRHGERRARDDNDQISAILGSIPGLELAGVVASPPELDYDCGPIVANLEPARWRELRADGWAALRATGADLVVTKSHACQREWCELGDHATQVRCYISVVADALGCHRSYPANLLADLKQTGATGSLVQLTRANWTSHGWSESEAAAAISRYNWSGTDPDRLSP